MSFWSYMYIVFYVYCILHQPHTWQVVSSSGKFQYNLKKKRRGESELNKKKKSGVLFLQLTKKTNKEPPVKTLCSCNLYFFSIGRSTFYNWLTHSMYLYTKNSYDLSISLNGPKRTTAQSDPIWHNEHTDLISQQLCEYRLNKAWSPGVTLGMAHVCVPTQSKYNFWSTSSAEHSESVSRGHLGMDLKDWSHPKLHDVLKNPPNTCFLLELLLCCSEPYGGFLRLREEDRDHMMETGTGSAIMR